MQIFLLAFWLSLPTFASEWGPNDISLLLPLPPAGANPLWAPSSAGKGGPLLPFSVFEELGDIASDLDAKTLYQEALRVLSVRVDPCFREASLECQRQVRLVWQPIVREGESWHALDAAIHTFYAFDPESWKTFLADLRSVRRPTSASRVEVHPVLSKEGYQGPFWRDLTRVFLRHCGSANLTRATAMSVNPIGTQWVFSGVDFQGSKKAPIAIPRTRSFSQGFFANANASSLGEFRAAMNPYPEKQPELLTLLHDSKGARSKMPSGDLQSAVRAALALENPRLSDPGLVDCASCHVAPTVTSWALQHFAAWNWSELFSNELFHRNRKPEPGAGLPRINVLRAFGYFGREPVISRRVQYETEEGLERME